MTVILGPSPAPAAVPDTEWPTFHGDTARSGVSADTAIAASTASTLGLAWATNTGQPTYASPAVAYEPRLGRTLVYQSTKARTIDAYDASTGERVWYFRTGAYINASAAVYHGVVYVGSADHYLYALDGATGALVCRFDAGGVLSSSPLVVDPDGHGAVVYVGDNGLSGSDDGGHLWAVNAVDPDADADCSPRWSYTGFDDADAGVWAAPSFARTPAGEPLVVVGSSSSDNAVYAVDAVTGARVWRFQTEVFFPDNDVGAAASIGAPGANGVANGAAYVCGKDQICYAIDVVTGAKLWEFRVRDDAPDAAGTTRSTAALVDGHLFVGFGGGVYALDAASGAKLWRADLPGGQEVISSPAVSGPAGDRVVVVGDLTGRVYALDASTGAVRWSYATGGFIYGSAAIATGRIFIGSSDGFLYAFAPGGPSGSPPSTAITSPTDGSTVAGPTVTLGGTADDDSSVREVLVAIRNRGTNAWWNAATSTWDKVFVQNPAALGRPGSGQTTWSLAFPAGTTGMDVYAQAEAVDGDGTHDVSVPSVRFTVASAGAPPETTITAPVNKQVFNFASLARQPFLITVTGTATDSGGSRLGVKKVFVVVRNLEHSEYYCGAPGCAGSSGETSAYGPTFAKVTATLASPAAQTTTWSLSFPVYDHPHHYGISAWAVDGNGERDVTKAKVRRVCVQDPGVTACG